MLCLIYMHDACGVQHRGRVRIYQAKHECLSCVKTNMLHFWHSEMYANLKSTAQLAYIVTDVDCDCERYFNIFITFSNVSVTYPIVLLLIMGLYSH